MSHKYSTEEFPYTRHRASPNIIILQNHDTLVKTEKLTLAYCYELNNKLFSLSQVFPPVSKSSTFLVRQGLSFF